MKKSGVKICLGLSSGHRNEGRNETGKCLGQFRSLILLPLPLLLHSISISWFLVDFNDLLIFFSQSLYIYLFEFKSNQGNFILIVKTWHKFELIKRFEICNSNIFKEFHSCTPPFNSRQIDQVQMGCKLLKFRYSKMATKGGFFSESAIRFFRSPNLKKKKYSKKLSWAWNLNFPPITLYCYWRGI